VSDDKGCLSDGVCGGKGCWIVCRDQMMQLQSDHKQLKEDFDTAYKELEWERKRADELQEQLEAQLKAKPTQQDLTYVMNDLALKVSECNDLKAQLKECVDVLTKIDQFFDNADHCEYTGCPNMIPDKIWDLIDPLLADLNKLKRGG
jgi:predicted nuclease with TOPRIM domain